MTCSESPGLSVTDLLIRWRSGDDAALEQLMPKVYHELRRLAGSHLRGERPGQTLSATDLVHEAFLGLVEVDISWQNRAHFLAVGARMMRRILVNRSRAKARLKRGAGAMRITLSESHVAAGQGSAVDLLELDRALERLFEVDERKARAVELFYFGGLTYEEVAVAMDISRATAHRDLHFARAWLSECLESKP